MASEPEVFYLYRTYETPPFRRFACAVQYDPETRGPLCVDSDPVVADTAFKAQAMDVFTRPATDRGGGKVGHAHFATAEDLDPGTEEHFEVAIRQVPGAVVGMKPEGR